MFCSPYGAHTGPPLAVTSCCAPSTKIRTVLMVFGTVYISKNTSTGVAPFAAGIVSVPV
jgi:hypothetical protein